MLLVALHVCTKLGTSIAGADLLRRERRGALSRSHSNPPNILWPYSDCLGFALLTRLGTSIGRFMMLSDDAAVARLDTIEGYLCTQVQCFNV